MKIQALARHYLNRSPVQVRLASGRRRTTASDVRTRLGCERLEQRCLLHAMPWELPLAPADVTALDALASDAVACNALASSISLSSSAIGPSTPSNDAKSADEVSSNEGTVNENTVNEDTVNEDTVNEDTVNEDTVNDGAASVEPTKRYHFVGGERLSDDPEPPATVEEPVPEGEASPPPIPAPQPGSTQPPAQQTPSGQSAPSQNGSSGASPTGAQSSSAGTSPETSGTAGRFDRNGLDSNSSADSSLINPTTGSASNNSPNDGRGSDQVSRPIDGDLRSQASSLTRNDIATPLTTVTSRGFDSDRASTDWMVPFVGRSLSSDGRFTQSSSRSQHFDFDAEASRLSATRSDQPTDLDSESDESNGQGRQRVGQSSSRRRIADQAARQGRPSMRGTNTHRHSGLSQYDGLLELSAVDVDASVGRGEFDSAVRASRSGARHITTSTLLYQEFDLGTSDSTLDSHSSGGGSGGYAPLDHGPPTAAAENHASEASGVRVADLLLPLSVVIVGGFVATSRRRQPTATDAAGNEFDVADNSTRRK